MKRNFMRVAGLLAISGLLGACTSAPAKFQTGPDAETTFDGLVRVDNTVLSKVWARPDTELTEYTKVLPVVTGVQFRPAKKVYASSARRTNQENFPLSDAEKERFEIAVKETFQEEFAKSEKFELTDQPGDDVLLIRVEILDVASNLPPDAPGQTLYVRTIGEAGLVLEVFDSKGKQILLRAADRRAFTFPGDQIRMTSRGLTASQVKNGLRGWARVLVKGLDSIKE